MDNDTQSVPEAASEATQLQDNNIEPATDSEPAMESQPATEPQPAMTPQSTVEPQPTAPQAATAEPQSAAAAAPTPPKRNTKKKIIIIVAIVAVILPIIIIALFAAAPYLITLFIFGAVNTRTNMQAATANLDSMSSAICEPDGYSILFQRPNIKDSAIIKCNETTQEYGKNIYSVTDTKEGRSGFMITARATYIGTTEDSRLDERLNGQKYLFRLPNENENGTVIVLAEADTEESAVGQVYDGLYEFYLEYNKLNRVKAPLDIAIFYAADLKEVASVKDYLVLSSVIGLPTNYPGGNGYGDYSFKTESPSENMNWLVEHSESYPAAVTEAIKQNRHASFKISKSPSKEEFRQSLLDSFTK